MAKRTLLELTQEILSSMDSDGVNSISDTIEATQVAQVIRRTYFNIVAELDLPFKNDIVNLTGLGDVTKPTHFLIPENVQQVYWIKYDKRDAVASAKEYLDVVYKTPEEFVRFVSSRDSTDTTSNQVVQYNANSPLVISKIYSPSYWTSFDDEYIVMDSYDSDVDSTLQTSKVMSHGSISPTFTFTDAAIPDLPENLFPLLYAQAEGVCHANHKQTVNPKSEQIENRLRIRQQRNKWRESRMTHEGVNYGRA